MPDETLSLLLDIRSQISSAVKGLESTQVAMEKAKGSTSRLSGAFGFLKSSAKTMSGMLMRDVVQGAKQVISESITLGGQIQTLKNSFDSLVQASGSTTLSLDSLTTATRGTVSDINLLTAANQALALGLPTEGLDDLFGAAIKLGHAMGIDASYAVDSLTKGIGRQSKMILDNLGVVFDASDAYEWYAQKIGVNSSALDENQRKLAWQEYAMTMVTEKAAALGDITSETTLKQEQFRAKVENLKAAIGERLLPVVEGITTFLVDQVFPALDTYVLPAFDALATFITDYVVPAFKTHILPALNAFVGFIKDPVIPTLQSIYDTFKTVFEGIAGFISDPIGTIKTAISGLIGSITGSFRDMVSSAFDWGAGLLKAFVNGILAWVEKIPLVGGMIAGKIRDWLGIESAAKMGPLSGLERWGPDLVKTYAKGIRSSLPLIERAMSELPSIDVRAPITPAPTGGGVGGGLSSLVMPVTISINKLASDRDEMELIEKVKGAIAESLIAAGVVG